MIQIIKISKKKKTIKKSLNIISEARKLLKKYKVVKEILKDYGYDKDIIDGIPISFSDEIDVTAKTIDGKIYLSEGLMSKSMNTIMRYLVHEIVHVFQHAKNEGKKQKEYREYLDDPDEREAFARQIQFHAQTKGKSSAEKYVKDLIDFHEISSDKKEDLENSLLNGLA